MPQPGYVVNKFTKLQAVFVGVVTPPPPPNTHTTRSHSRGISKSSLSKKIFPTHTPQHYKEPFKRCCPKQSVLKDPSPTGAHTTRSHSSDVAQSTLYLKIISTQNNQRLNPLPPPLYLVVNRAGAPLLAKGPWAAGFTWTQHSADHQCKGHDHMPRALQSCKGQWSDQNGSFHDTIDLAWGGGGVGVECNFWFS